MLKFFFYAATFSFLFVFLPSQAEATGIKNSGFQVYPSFSTEQIDPKSSYFHIPFFPGETKTLKLVLENFSEDEKTILIQTNNALSSPLVNIDYQEKEKTFYSHFIDPAFALKNLIVIDKEIILERLEKKEVVFKITTPSTITEGEILGAISFQEADRSQPTSSNKDEMSVKVQRKYTIAVLLETDKKSVHHFLIKDAQVNVDTGAPLIYTQIENHSADIVKGVILSYQLKKAGSEDILSEKTLNLNTFAPKTSMNVPIDWNSENFSPGDYVIDFSLTESDGTVLSQERKTLSIGENSVNKLIDESEKNQKENVVVVHKKVPAWVYVVSVGFFFLLILNTFYLYKRFKSNNPKTK